MRFVRTFFTNLNVLEIKIRDRIEEWLDDLQNYKRMLFNKKGQGLIEYLIIIAIMGVASIGILRTLNQTVKAKFANSVYALQGRKQKASTEGVRKTDYQKIDFSNFMTGAASKDDKNKQNKKGWKFSNE